MKKRSGSTTPHWATPDAARKLALCVVHCAKDNKSALWNRSGSDELKLPASPVPPIPGSRTPILAARRAAPQHTINSPLLLDGSCGCEKDAARRCGGRSPARGICRGSAVGCSPADGSAELAGGEWRAPAAHDAMARSGARAGAAEADSTTDEHTSAVRRCPSQEEKRKDPTTRGQGRLRGSLALSPSRLRRPGGGPSSSQERNHSPHPNPSRKREGDAAAAGRPSRVGAVGRFLLGKLPPLPHSCRTADGGHRTITRKSAGCGREVGVPDQRSAGSKHIVADDPAIAGRSCGRSALPRLSSAHRAVPGPRAGMSAWAVLRAVREGLRAGRPTFDGSRSPQPDKPIPSRPGAKAPTRSCSSACPPQ